MTPVDGELLRTLGGVMLVFVRSWAILNAQALWRGVLGPLWWAVAAGLALLLAPMTGPIPAAVSWVSWAVAAAAELALGTAVGTLASLPGYALLGAAAASARSLGVVPRPMVAVFTAVALLAGLSLGLHRPLLGALLAFSDTFTVGDPAAWLPTASSVGLERLVRGLQALLVLALALATPVLLVVAIFDVGLRLLGRGPEPVAAVVEPVAIWARFAGALLALGASWAVFHESWGRAIGRVP